MYKKIIEHELAVAGQENKLKLMVNSMGNKVDESVKMMKDLHENTVKENQKSEKLFVDNYEPVKEELEHKVDQDLLAGLVRQIV